MGIIFVQKMNDILYLSHSSLILIKCSYFTSFESNRKRSSVFRSLRESRFDFDFFNFPFLILSLYESNWTGTFRSLFNFSVFFLSFFPLFLGLNFDRIQTPFFQNGPNFCAKLDPLNDFYVRRSSYHLKAQVNICEHSSF